MSFAHLVWLNVLTHKVRSLLTIVAVAIAITAVVALGVLTHSLRRTAASILTIGTADFTVAQKGVSDILYSAVDDQDVSRIQAYPEVESAVGVLVASVDLDSSHPFFLELGIPPDQLTPFGVQVVAGQPYTATAEDEVMLGYRAARDLNKTVGDTIDIETLHLRIVGIYSTGNVFGDSASMLPLTTLQARERKPGEVTLVAVRVRPGNDIDKVRKKIEQDSPQLATVRTESEFGRVDRNLTLLSAANVGVSIMALVIGAVGVMNTMAMSVFERTREFGVLRAVGWSKRRVLALVMAEALILSLAGAAVGVGAGLLAVRGIERVPELLGVFQPDYTWDVFAKALGIAVGMAFIGAAYPAVRAALLTPMEALRHE